MDKNIISCGDVLDISVVAKMHEELKHAIENSTTIELDAKDLQRIDGAGIQLLVSLFADAQELQIDLSWGETSESLLHAATLLGVRPQLHLN